MKKLYIFIFIILLIYLLIYNYYIYFYYNHVNTTCLYHIIYYILYIIYYILYIIYYILYIIYRYVQTKLYILTLALMPISVRRRRLYFPKQGY